MIWGLEAIVIFDSITNWEEVSSIVFTNMGLVPVDIYGGDCGGNVIFRVAFINVDL